MSGRPPAAWLPPLSLALAGVAACLLLEGPAGSDPDLWIFSALNLEAVGTSSLPPGFPALVALAHPWLGEPFTCARWVAGVAAPLVPVGAWLLARALGATPLLAWAAGASCLLQASVLAFDAQVMPETWATTWFLGCALAAVRFVDRPDPARTLVFALLAAGAPLWREHGIAIALGMIVGAATPAGGVGVRAGRVAVVGAAVLILPALVGGRVDVPWAQPWLERFDTMGLPNDVGAALPDPTWMDRPAWALALGGDAYLWAVLGIAATLRPSLRHVALLAVLLPGLGGLAVWSQPRHVAVVLPVAFAAWAARPGRGWWWLGGLATIAGIVRGQFHLDRLDFEAARIEDLRRFGVALCARAEPGDLAWGEPSAFLFCPLPRHELDGSAADWKVWAVAHTPRTPAPWTEVDLGVGVYDVWRLAPRLVGSARPCHASRPAPDTPYLASPPRPARLEPPCEAAMPTEAEPTRRRRPRGSAGP